MAIQHHNHQLHQEQLDALYCDEEQEEYQEFSGESDVTTNHDDEDDDDDDDGVNLNSHSLEPLLLLEQDMFWEDEELNTLFSKEKLQHQAYFNNGHDVVTPLEPSSSSSSSSSYSSLCVARREAVEWILKVNAHYGFSALTATLAVTYLDRFLLSFHFQREKPWMIQLASVTCISLAAKVEETQVPLLLDLQVQDAKYVFEAKTIQKMELLILSTLNWKMHPVTPLSFLDHIIRRLGLKTNLHWHFLRRCENLLLSLLLDSRFVGCLPSVLATATMLHVIDQIHHSTTHGMEYKNQLLNVLNINKEKVDECYNGIVELWSSNGDGGGGSKKRKHEQIPGSPSGVIDAVFSSVDGSNDSWAVVGSSFLCSSPSQEPLFKKNKQQQLKLSSLNRVIVGIVGTTP
ncbi:hypothetical protein PIB30_017338 [Stylosanthes scabra]|uniref:B-like cyclin n=1 Tax=Stylosanthes scabra TaxID=79078 RepID=A0ABU6T8D2_9FABA|nr:hypothetical protein [Stylosanthes scabra]